MPRQRGRALLLALTTTVLLACASEIGLRLFRPVAFLAPPPEMPTDAWRTLLHRPSDVPGLPYELVPSTFHTFQGIPIRTNAAGMRDDPPRMDAHHRILVAGDSFTFGLGVRASETYPAVLEARLCADARTDSCDVDVLNAGVSGYSAREIAAVVRSRTPVVSPSLIVVAYVLNDPERLPIQTLRGAFTPVAAWRHSHLLRLAVEAWITRGVRRAGSYNHYLHRPGSAEWRHVEEAFADIRSAAGDIPVLLVLFPDTPIGGWTTYPYADLHAQVTAAAGAAGFATLDLEDVFAAVPPAALRLSPADHHPTPRAHALAAEAILTWIRANVPALSPPAR